MQLNACNFVSTVVELSHGLRHFHQKRFVFKCYAICARHRLLDRVILCGVFVRTARPNEIYCMWSKTGRLSRNQVVLCIVRVEIFEFVEITLVSSTRGLSESTSFFISFFPVFVF